MFGIFTMPVSDVQEWSVKISNRLDNFLQSYDNLNSTKGLRLIITRLTDATPRTSIR